jgi:colanic acid biosynthesis glycosyl transferase WcaI
MSCSSPRRILFLNQTFLPDPLATSQYLARWAAELAREGNEVTVLTSRRAYHKPGVCHAREEQWKGVRVVRVNASAFGKGARWRRALDFASFLGASLVRGLFLPRPDVIIGLTSPPLISFVAAILAWRFRARFVYWVMDLNPDAAVAAGWLKESSIAGRVLERLSRWSLGRAERVVALDAYIKERLVAKGVPEARIEIIPLWMQGEIDFDEAGREEFRQAHGWQKKFVVMLAGNHGPCHPLETLLAAAAQLENDPRLHFCLVGGGAEWGRLRRRAARSRNITLIDYVPPAQLASVLSAADLQVVIMGDPFVGIVHPCKIYNLLATQRPFVYIGPPHGPIADLIAEAQLGEAAASFRHGEGEALAHRLRLQAASGPIAWPCNTRTDRWNEPVLLEKMTSTLSYMGRFP